jgi:putative two-component system response regulator
MEVPVIFITSLDSPADEDKGFRLGAVDYITKPFRPSTVLARVNAQLELKDARDRLKDQNLWLENEDQKRSDEIQLIQNATLNALMQLSEMRDENTGNHIRRTSKYVEILATELKNNPSYAHELSDEKIRSIVRASQLHDIGKIGIPDHILRKPEKLTNVEFDIIKSHCVIGAGALKKAKDEACRQISVEDVEKLAASLMFLDEAETIAKCHHEKWDGTGYPEGRRGAEIQLSARLMALADVFDALTTVRPYKAAWPVKDAAAYIMAQEGKAFDPDIVYAFEKKRDEFQRIMEDFTDAEITEGKP